MKRPKNDMVHGKLESWGYGRWYIYQAEKQRRHYLNETSEIEIEHKGSWHKVKWSDGPGGFYGSYDDGRDVKEGMDARIVSNERVD